MEIFLDSNPGLKSRFNKHIVFDDYSNDELLAIFKAFCAPYGMELNSEAESCIEAYLEHLVANKPENFANGREMRNLFESVVENQANRLSMQNDLSDEDLSVFVKADLPAWVLEQ